MLQTKIKKSTLRGAFCIINTALRKIKKILCGVIMMSEFKDKTRENDFAAAAVKYGAWLLGLIIVLYFIARNVFPFIRSLF